MRLRNLLHLTLLIILPFVAEAQKDTVFINEVVIKADKPSAVPLEGNRVIQIISKELINNLPVQSLNELLEYAIDVDVRKRGVDEVQADISIRGGSAEQTLILLNGIRVNDPQTGHHNLDIPIELSQVDRIEILEGSGARQFGANAFCGVINIITNQSDKSFLKLSGLGGMNGLYSGAVSAGFADKNTSQFISVSGKKCDGYTRNTDYDVLKGYYSSNYYTKKGTFNLQGGYEDKAFGANSFYTAKYPDQFEHTKTFFGSVQFSTAGKVKLTPQVYYRLHHDRFELFRSEAPSWYKNDNYHLTQVIGGSMSLQFNGAMSKTGIRAEYFLEKINSNVLGTSSGDTMKDMMDPSVFFTKIAHRSNISLSAEHQFTNNNFSFALGLLANYNENFGFDVYPGLELSFNFKPWLKWYFTANKSFRLPTFTDLYYAGPTNIGNPDLKPEKAYSFETGFKFVHNNFFAHVAGFYRLGENIIDWVKQPDSVKWESANITELQTWGFESSAGFTIPKPNWTIFPLLTITASYSYLNSTKNSGSYISYYAMDYLKHKFTMRENVILYKKIGGTIEFTYCFRNGTYTDFATGLETKYNAFNTTDVKLFWRPTNFDVYVSCNNFFNAKYFDFGNIPMPGIWVMGGLNYKFDFSRKTKKNG